MIGKMQTAWLLRIVMRWMLLIGLFPMLFMSMQAGHMATPSGASAFYEKASSGRDVPPPCCNDTINSLSHTCGGLAPHFACAIRFAGTQRIALSPLFVHVTYSQTATPPPKI